MNKLIVFCAALLADSALAAETYKWGDERGIIDYYFPTGAGSFMTMMTERQGRIFNTERERKTF